MIAFLIILYLIIGLAVGIFFCFKEFGPYEFEEFIEDMDFGDFWSIFCCFALIWPILLIVLGIPALFRLIILSVIKKMKEEKKND